MRHVIEAQQFTRTDLDALFALATRLESRRSPSLRGRILATLFYEPSTRTRFSFESAMLRLGGNVLTTENASEFSSAAKGETIEDTVRVVGAYADAIVLRHYEVGVAKRAASVSPVPIINAGDGAGQHPTQALLDLYTIERERGSVDGVRVAMVGDLRHGRTVRSLSYLLAKYENVHIDLVAPPELQMGEDIKTYLKEHQVSFSEHEELDGVITKVNIVYQTRIQKERFADPQTYEKHRGRYVLTPENTHAMKDGAIIMHPLPRVDEIAPELDALPKAAYFRQAAYGLLVRMALLERVLGDG